MSFPNTAYKPGDEVWYLRVFKQISMATVRTVVWDKEGFHYTLNSWSGIFYENTLFPTEEAAQEAANKEA